MWSLTPARGVLGRQPRTGQAGGDQQYSGYNVWLQRVATKWGAVSDRRGVTRRALVRDWAVAVSETAYLPLSVAEVEQRLLALLEAVVDRLVAGADAAEEAFAAGVGLVELNCTGQHSLRRTIEVLGDGLPQLAELVELDSLGPRVVTVLGSCAGGYADAVRRRTFQQQEDVRNALAGVLRLSEARLREVFTNSAIGIAITRLDGTMVQTNRALADILGYGECELALRNLRELLGSAGSAAGDQLWATYQDLASGRSGRFRIQRPLVRGDGERIWVYLAVSVLRDEQGEPSHYVTMVEDVTDLYLAQVQLGHQAMHDVLTGLPNRQGFALRLESALGQLDPEAQVTLFHLDIDSFSVINDGLGYEVGDRLLREVALRLAAIFATERATLGRIASDEFAVLVEHSPTTPSAASFAASINEELSEPVYLDGTGLAVSATIGVVRRQAGGVTVAELLRQADSTLRQAKGRGKRQWALFDWRQDQRDREWFAVAAALPGALENGEFQVVYRPLVRLADDAVVAVEALLRWEHPERGRFGHSEVVRLAERTGMALPINQWLLRTAAEQAVASNTSVVVNLPTSVSNDPDLVATVNSVLDSTGLRPDLLQLGLSLRALLCEEGEAEDNLRVLTDRGVGTSIHGFGGGHGGLVFLEDLPVRSVWIAGWLVDRLAARPDSVTGRAMRELISLVHTFGATVTTAGLRTGEQVDWWRATGGDVACGDWFAPPGPVAAFAAGQRG